MEEFLGVHAGIQRWERESLWVDSFGCYIQERSQIEIGGHRTGVAFTLGARYQIYAVQSKM